jgi:hypothetical protein
MFRALLTSVLLLAASASQAESLVAHHIGTPVSRNVVYMSQEIAIAGGQAESAKIAPLVTSTAGFGIDKNAVKLNALPVAGLPRINIANPTTQTAALTVANTWATANMPAFQSRIGNYMRTQGLSSAFFTFTQEINVSTVLGTKRQAIGFNVTVDQNGRPLFGAPKVVDPDPLILEAMYTPMAAAAGLPTNWTFPNAGTIKYRVMNKKYVPLTGYYTVNVNGAFDSEPDAADPDAKLRCLMDLRNAGCSGPTDIRTIAGQVGASLAIVDYVRQLEPDYDQMPDGTLVAKGAISYDERFWDCLSYINTGYFGYVLNMRAERYSMTPSANLSPYQLLQMFGGKTISPTTAFNKSVPIASLNGAAPASVVISPHPGDNTLWQVNDATAMHNVVYLAPVRARGGDGSVNFVSTSNADTNIRLESSSGDVREYYLGMVCKACWSTNQYDRSVSFSVNNPASLDELAIIQEGYDDWLSVTVNGTTVFVGPKGGNMLQWNRSADSTEQSCSGSDGNYTCWRKNIGTTAVDANFNAVAPWSGCYKTSETTYDQAYYPVPTDPTKPKTYKVKSSTWTCPVTYSYCRFKGNGNYGCRDTACPENTVQYIAGISYVTSVPWNGTSGGCGSPELSTSWRNNTYIDLRPYLRSGTNTISMKTITWGSGEGFIKVRSKACGVNMGLDRGANPPVPTTGGNPGVTTDVLNDAR